MADDLAAAPQASPNYINPAYASPEQAKSLRDLAAQLMGPDHQFKNVHRATQGISNMVNALIGGYSSAKADKLQSDATAKNAEGVTALVQQLQSGQQPDAGTVGQLAANPFASPEQRGLITQLIHPEATKDVYGRPAYQSPAAGVNAAPIKGPYTPGNLVPTGVEGVSTQIPTPAPTTPSGNRPGTVTSAPIDPVNPQGGVFGGTKMQPAGWNGQPPGSPVPSTPMTIDQLAAKGRELAAAKKLTDAGATAQGEGNQEDIRAATAAPAVLKGLGLIKSSIQASPDMTFGPSAKMTAEVKRAIANYAPGLVDEKSLAGTDAVEKLNFGLATQLAKSAGGTQGELFKAIGATPGTEKSKAGTMALIDMIQQDQMKAQQLGGVYRQMEQAGRLQDYPAAREQFLTQHPTTNPLTGRPIEMDIKATREAAASTASGPPVGSTHNGYRFKGGNPNDKSAWEKL